MSLSQRIFAAFTLVIILAITLSIAVGYFTAQVQLDAFTKELGRIEANNLARNLSQTYTLSGSWDTLDVALSEAGYLYSEEHGELGESEEEGGEENSEFFHLDRIRIVIVDIDNIVVYDNFSELDEGESAQFLDGQHTTITDLGNNHPVGYAYVDVNRKFLATESLGFLNGLLISSAIGGLLIAVIALFLSTWLSKRITAPVTALTQATQMIAKEGDTALLPVTSSDELGQMSVAFNQMTTSLQTQRDLRKRLINDVSHELNTPLSVIRLEAHGLRKKLQTPKQAADHIIQEVNMLQNLVSDLNWLAETETEDLRLKMESCSIHQLLATEVERWQPQMKKQKIIPSLLDSPELPLMKFDRLRMSQALGNIIGNALQHTGADGQVSIAAVVKKNEYVEITVTDNGVGINAADLPHIFNRFYRTEQSRNRRTGGRGLGLAIARAIIEAHNGAIVITSDGIGQGTIVRIKLPLKQPIKTPLYSPPPTQITS